MLKYTAEHEWILVEGEKATIGITHHAQEALGDVVFVDLPKVGKSYAQGGTAGVVESVKAAADVYMPMDAEVLEVNSTLIDEPSLLNSDPLNAGWLFKVKIQKPDQINTLLDEAAYKQLLKAQ